ncbi:glycine betaine/proline transport system ATP-binding protein [Methylopila capsulata]|uniref:Trimethylamine N-oxide transport system ATP-binding protein TmoW n=1 Tax=Methylopila capsulata TaxID=61654 RepID=A0A9W6IW69_9HYPH|nr:ATP-binding cassette domain-containing protein [Methylopila capsulata]MBM7852214.1 glycine betaine/proline transport system ATP-binding protein [Methylopila capsulata]GLK56420.1 ABC transporter ATP-binding protein [Methylopila capsulata]
MSHPILACRGVAKLYGAKASRFVRDGRFAGAPEELSAAGVVSAVRDVDLEIARGETFVIMGLSGSGKSTLVRCLSALTPPSAGEVLFEGKNLNAMAEGDLLQIRRHQMGMVFQNFALLPHLTVLGNVAFPLDVQGVRKAEREAKALEMIRLVGLSGREGRFPRELSGGQQQRVGIARSLAVKPDLWFLDEPFSALDPLIRREMQDEVLRLQGLLKKTIVFITHDFDEAVRIADRIAIMKDGRIEQIGTAEELVLHPATDYVRAFTQEAPRAKILTARAVMAPAPSGADFAGRVEARARIASFAHEVEAADRPFAVVDGGAVIGVVDRLAMIDVLVGRERKAAAA